MIWFFNTWFWRWDLCKVILSRCIFYKLIALLFNMDSSTNVRIEKWKKKKKTKRIMVFCSGKNTYFSQSIIRNLQLSFSSLSQNLSWPRLEPHNNWGITKIDITNLTNWSRRKKRVRNTSFISQTPFFCSYNLILKDEIIQASIFDLLSSSNSRRINKRRSQGIFKDVSRAARAWGDNESGFFTFF